MTILRSWQFIDTGYNTGTHNMFFDEELLHRFNPDKTAGVFRLYEWAPPAISLGRFQNTPDILNMDECSRDNINIVRRMTGGGAIFHDRELTYSIVCRSDCIDSQSVKDSYKKLSHFLILAYKELGLTAYFANDNKPPDFNLGKKTDFCFAGTEFYDILINGKKIGGNAQKRKKNIIFQHGSIPLSLDIDKLRKYFKNPIETDAVSLLQLTDKINIIDLKEIIKRSFMKNMNIRFEQG